VFPKIKSLIKSTIKAEKKVEEMRKEISWKSGWQETEGRDETAIFSLFLKLDPNQIGHATKQSVTSFPS
jgi:hypothetical protein